MLSKQIRLAVAASVFLGFLATVAVADELEAVEKKIQAAWSQHKSMTARVTTVSRMEQAGQVMDGKGDGTYEFLRKGEQLLSRMELKNSMTQKMGEQEMKMEQQVTMVVDGTYAYTLSDQATEFMGNKMPPQVMAMKMDIEPEMSGEPSKMFADLHKDHDVKLLPAETVNGKQAYVFEATPKEKAPGNPAAKMLLYFDQANGFTVKMVVQSEDGKPIQTITYEDVKLDVDIDPDRFVFKAPEGVEVMDQTTKKP